MDDDIVSCSSCRSGSALHHPNPFCDTDKMVVDPVKALNSAVKVHPSTIPDLLTAKKTMIEEIDLEIVRKETDQSMTPPPPDLTAVKNIGWLYEHFVSLSYPHDSPIVDMDAFLSRYDRSCLIRPSNKPALFKLKEQYTELVRLNSLISQSSEEYHDKRESLYPERRLVLAKIHRLEAFLAPINRFPCDLLLETFFHVSYEPLPLVPIPPPTEENSLDSPPPDLPLGISSRAGPLLLSLVSKKWRNIALSTPKLFTQLFFITPITDPFLAIDFWLKHSGSSKLEVALHLNQSKWGSQPRPDVARIYTTLVPHAMRIVALFISTPHDDLTDNFLAAPELRQLQIAAGKCDSYHFELRAPKLDTLQIDEPTVRLGRNLILHGQQLTCLRLTVHFLESKHFVDVLLLTGSTLVALEFHYACRGQTLPVPPDDTASTPIELFRLKCLKFTLLWNPNPGSYGHALERLRIPNLEDLALSILSLEPSDNPLPLSLLKLS